MIPRGRLLGQPGATESPGLAPGALTETGRLQEAFGMDGNERACATSMEICSRAGSTARVVTLPVSTAIIPVPGFMIDVLKLDLKSVPPLSSQLAFVALQIQSGMVLMGNPPDWLTMTHPLQEAVTVVPTVIWPDCVR
jgi:hypothetical protein